MVALRDILLSVLLLPVLLTDTQPAHPLALLSIDLGAEWLKVGILSRNAPTSVSIVTNELGSRKTPSLIGFSNVGDRLLGDEAASFASRYPETTFPRPLSLLGKRADDASVAQMLADAGLLYHVVQHPSRGVAAVHVNHEGVASGEELVASLLRYAMQISAAQLGGPVKEAVVTVPAYFGQAQRQAYIDAASLAGLSVLGVINSHAAAALHYGLNRYSSDLVEHIIFYDLGAGSVEVALVLDVDWDDQLGGSNLDAMLCSHFVNKFSLEHGLEPVQVLGNARAMAKLKKQEILSANKTQHHARGYTNSSDGQGEWLSMKQLSGVELLGGGPRIPKLQVLDPVVPDLAPLPVRRVVRFAHLLRGPLGFRLHYNSSTTRGPPSGPNQLNLAEFEVHGIDDFLSSNGILHIDSAEAHIEDLEGSDRDSMEVVEEPLLPLDDSSRVGNDLDVEDMDKSVLPKVRLDIRGPGWLFPHLSGPHHTAAEARAAAEANIAAWNKADAEREEAAAAKDELEGYVLQMKHWMESGDDELQGIPEGAASAFRMSLSETEEWLYSNGDRESGTTFRARLSDLGATADSLKSHLGKADGSATLDQASGASGLITLDEVPGSDSLDKDSGLSTLVGPTAASTTSHGLSRSIASDAAEPGSTASSESVGMTGGGVSSKVPSLDGEGGVEGLGHGMGAGTEWTKYEEKAEERSEKVRAQREREEAWEQAESDEEL
eukprot:gene13455-19313_t